jgi:hypothetical protein
MSLPLESTMSTSTPLQHPGMFPPQTLPLQQYATGTMRDSPWTWTAPYDVSATSSQQQDMHLLPQPLHHRDLYEVNPLLAGQMNPAQPTFATYSPYANTYNANLFTQPTSQVADVTCPRTYPDMGVFPTMSNQVEAYPPSAYQLEPRTPVEYRPSPDQMDEMDHSSPMNLEACYDGSYSSPIKLEMEGDEYGLRAYDQRFEYGPAYESATADEMCSPLEEPSQEQQSGEVTPDREEPYAKLIYRCLMDAPGRAMVLRDIYDWFQQNTDKANNKETKGWQNSIRHNLSMNGVNSPRARVDDR